MTTLEKIETLTKLKTVLESHKNTGAKIEGKIVKYASLEVWFYDGNYAEKISIPKEVADLALRAYAADLKISSHMIKQKIDRLLSESCGPS